MIYHKQLAAQRVRALPWKTQIGMIASELSRVRNLQGPDAGPEVLGCLQRAREILGLLESSPAVPLKVALPLLKVAEELSLPRLGRAAGNAEALYRQLMALYSA
jgi:hypothetical protein